MKRSALVLPALSLGLVLALALPSSGGDAPPVPGMSLYQFGLLRRGPAWTPSRTPATDSLQAGHMANIGRMAREGYLLAAGPLLDGGNLRGIFIFHGDSAARVREQVARDPAVAAGRLVMDLYTWFAPSGIGAPYKALAQRPGHRDSMVRLQIVLLKTGPRGGKAPTEESAAIQGQHVNAMFRAIAAGELATAGSFTDGGELRGILVYRSDSTTAHRRSHEDPAVKAGYLVAEQHPWFAA